MTAAPLILTMELQDVLAKLADRAASSPVNIATLRDKMRTAQGCRAHRQQMNRQTVMIPGPWMFRVTYALETDHPCGHARHLSVSILRRDRLPSQEATQAIGALLGFTDQLAGSKVYTEKSSDGWPQIHIVQPMHLPPIAA